MALEFHSTDHLLDDWGDLLNQINSVPSVEIMEDEFHLCGVMAFLEKRMTRKDNRLWPTFQLEMLIEKRGLNSFPGPFRKYGHILIDSSVLVVAGGRKTMESDHRVILQ
jgi:hypothetical protein